MTPPVLYRGPWPQNVNKLAKYAIRFVGNDWKVTVLYDLGGGLTYLAEESNRVDVVGMVNAVKTALASQPGGAFYINEYRHIIVPVADAGGSGTGSHYYFAGRLTGELVFDYSGEPLTTKPIHKDGSPLNRGEVWIGPRPGIPYVLAAGGGDVFYETPALTDATPPTLLKNTTRRVQLSRVLGNTTALKLAVAPVVAIKQHQGGRFYVNEHGAMFAPREAGDGNGIDYIYCGQLDPAAWFPEPHV